VGPLNVCSDTLPTLTGSGIGNYQWRNATGAISGVTSTTYTVPAISGVYNLLVTNPTTGCRRLSPPVTVNVTPKPTVSISPVKSAICIDSVQTLRSVTSVGTGTGNTFQWFNGTTALAAPAGIADSFVTTTPGMYTLRIRNNGICNTTSNVAELIVNPLPTSSFTKTGTTGAICLGSTFELTALIVPATSRYQWSLNGVDIPGATSRIFNASLGGIYTVRIIDSNNCRKTSDTASLINTPMGIPNLSPKSARFCEGTTLKLYSNAGPFAAKYLWSRNGTLLPDTTGIIISALDGTYDVTVTDVYGCVLISPKTTLTVDPLPAKPVIVKTGAILSTALAYSSYQWYRNGKALTGATLRSYTTTFDGKYHVVVTNGFNCFNISDTMSIQALSVQQVARENVNIDVYPNPAQNIINISAPLEVNVMVQDVQGKKILELKNAKQVDMSVYADGMYIFTITDKEGLVLKMDKVVKRTN
jgi:hypothetical protein